MTNNNADTYLTNQFNNALLDDRLLLFFNDGIHDDDTLGYTIRDSDGCCMYFCDMLLVDLFKKLTDLNVSIDTTRKLTEPLLDITHLYTTINDYMQCHHDQQYLNKLLQDNTVSQPVDLLLLLF